MPSLLRAEVDNNFVAFDGAWPGELNTARNALVVANSHFKDSYARITSIQAWRTSVLFKALLPDVEAFFFEAQNDLLVSHCLARCGSFRQALKALRSTIENTYAALYFMDHPVELRRWAAGSYRITFADLTAYFENHPDVSSPTAAGVALLRGEYATLSKAVHGSAKAFRMTTDLVAVRLWSADVPSVGKWATREKAVIQGLNLLLAHLFCDKLTGTQNRNLRETMGFVLTAAQRTVLRTKLNVKVISP